VKILTKVSALLALVAWMCNTQFRGRRAERPRTNLALVVDYAALQARLARKGALLGGMRADVALAIPTDHAELEEMLKDDAKVKAVYEGGGLGKFITNYVEASTKRDTSIATQVNELTQQALANWLKEQRESGAVTPIDLTPEQVQAKRGQTRNAIYSDTAPGAGADGEFKNFAEFFQAAWHGAPGLRNASTLMPKVANVQKVQNAYSSTVPSDGGLLIPEVLRSELLALSLETSVVRPRARIIPMESLRVPIPTVDDTSHVSSIFGGVVAYWTEEGAALVASSAKFGRVVLEAKKLTAYSEVPNELIADGPAFGAFLGQSLPEAISYYEDDAFINGTGVGEPLGFMNGNGIVSVTRAAGGNAVEFVDIVNMYTRMLPTSLDRAVWICSPDVLASLLQMTVTGATIPLWLTMGQVFGQPTMMIFGRPLIVSEKVSAAGTAGDLCFVDFGYYLVGDRQAMQAASSSEYRFGNDLTAYRVIERVDGRPWLNSAITPKNGSANTLSAYVKLS
jgi:HK97 family phage major capsid protein